MVNMYVRVLGFIPARYTGDDAAYVLVSCALTDVDESKFMWITANGCWWWSQGEVVDIPLVLTKALEARETDLEKVPYGHNIYSN